MIDDLEEKYWQHQIELYNSLGYDKKTKYLEWQPARWSANSVAVNHIFKNIQAINSVCEVGAGSAAFSLEMYRQNPKLHLTAIDRSKVACTYGKQISKDMEIPINYINNDIFKMNDAQKYDFVLSLGVIEHYPPEQQIEFINKCKSISNKYLMFAIPNQESIIFQSYINWCNKNNNNYEEEHKSLNTKQLEQLLKECGLKPIMVDGFQVFLSEGDFLSTGCKNHEYIEVLKNSLSKFDSSLGNVYPKYNFKLLDIPTMIKAEASFDASERLNLSFMTYILCEKV